MDRIEEVKGWLKLINEFPIEYTAGKICQLFEPKPDEGRLLTVERIKELLKLNTYNEQSPKGLDAEGFARDIIAECQARIEALIDIIGDLTDADDCVLDHHGDCQSHGYTKPCPMPKAKEVFRDFKAKYTSKGRDQKLSG